VSPNRSPGDPCRDVFRRSCRSGTRIPPSPQVPAMKVPGRRTVPLSRKCNVWRIFSGPADGNAPLAHSAHFLWFISVLWGSPSSGRPGSGPARLTSPTAWRTSARRGFRRTGGWRKALAIYSTWQDPRPRGQGLLTCQPPTFQAFEECSVLAATKRPGPLGQGFGSGPQQNQWPRRSIAVRHLFRRVGSRSV
jgi:hypothetical protein